MRAHALGACRPEWRFDFLCRFVFIDKLDLVFNLTLWEWE
jgi:hypothetical protein